MTGKISSVFFDHGGTLFDYYPSNSVIWTKIAKRLGVTITPDDPRIQRGLRTQIQEFDKIDKDFRELSEDELHKLNCSVLKAMGVDTEGSFEIVNEEFNTREQGRLFQIYPEAADTLRRIKQKGIKIGLISNIEMELVPKRRQSLQQHRIHQYFDAIILSAEVNAWKPDKEIFEIALRKIGERNPAQAIHVGDSLRADVMGARNAGLIPVLFDPLNLRSVENVITIKALSEILEYLD
ncbi:MAG: HAD family hydrolase [Promethearchaeota archaeon]